MKRKKASTKIAIFHGFICVKNTDPDMATIRMQSATAHRKICVRGRERKTRFSSIMDLDSPQLVDLCKELLFMAKISSGWQAIVIALNDHHHHYRDIIY